MAFPANPIDGQPSIQGGALYLFSALKSDWILYSGNIPGSDAIHWRDAFDALAAYSIRDGVLSGGRSFRSLQDNNKGHIPPSSGAGDAFWYLVADRGADLVTFETQHYHDGSHKSITADAVSINQGGDLLISGVSVLVKITSDVASAEASATQAAASATGASSSATAAATSASDTLAALSTALAANPQLDPQVRMNKAIVTTDLSIPAGYNAYAAGPLEVAAGINITVGDNANLTII